MGRPDGLELDRRSAGEDSYQRQNSQFASYDTEIWKMGSNVGARSQRNIAGGADAQTPFFTGVEGTGFGA